MLWNREEYLSDITDLKMGGIIPEADTQKQIWRTLMLSNLDEIWLYICLIVRMIVEELQINRETIRLILTEELDKRKIFGTWRKNRSCVCLILQLIFLRISICVRELLPGMKQTQVKACGGNPRVRRVIRSDVCHAHILTLWCWYDHKGVAHQLCIQ